MPSPTPGTPSCTPRRGARRAPLVVVLVTALLVALAAPAGALITGVDVASHQHPGGAPINWGSVKAAGHAYAFVKATEGTSYTNPYLASDWNGAGAAGLYRGAYHYARPGLPLTTALDQARYFVSRTGSMNGPADLPGVLDLEETGGLSPAQLAEWTRAWLGEVTRLTGKAPMVYTGYYFWRDSVGNPTDIGRAYRLWLPSYPLDPGSTTFKPLVPAGWATWTFWQYRSDGTVPGITGPVDMNRFCCDGPSLAGLAGTGAGGGGPFGSLDGVTPGYGGVQVSGWAMDPDSTDPIDVHVYVGGTGAALRAGASRPDVGSAYPGFGSSHGYSGFVAAPAGTHQVCAYGINVGAGPNRLLGCRTVTIPSGDPMGSLDQAAGRYGGISIAGWAVDPNTTGPIPVHVYVDGVGVPLTADRSRPDVGRALPGYGDDHGFAVEVPAAPGRHQVCAYGIDVAAPGGNRLLGCKTATVPPGTPFGTIDSAVTLYGLIGVSGWTIDPDTPAPTDVHVYVNGVGHAVRADRARPDVGAAFPAAGPDHGYQLVVPRVGAGPNDVCVYALNAAASGGNALLGCRRL